MPTGTITTFNQAATLQIRSVRDLIDMIDFRDAPLLKLLGLNNESKFRLRDFPRTKYEWFEDAMPGRTTTMNDAGGISNVDTAMTVVNGSLFKAGDVLKIEDELVTVSSVASNTLTISRATSGTTAVAHADLLPMELVGVARIENSDYVLGYTTSPTNLFNHTQIYDESVGVSRSEEKDSKYGIASTMAYHMSKLLSDGKRAGKLPILLEKSFYHGVRFEGGANNTSPRTMGGFNQFVTTNVVNKGGASLDLVDIENLMQTVNDAGGRPETIIVNSFAKRKISEFFKGSIRTTRDESIGGAVIDQVETEFGMLNLIWDWLCPPSDLYLIQKEKMGWIEFDPFQILDLPVTVDGKVKRIIGEYGFVLLNQLAHGRIRNFSTLV